LDHLPLRVRFRAPLVPLITYYLIKSTNHEAALYAVFSSLLLAANIFLSTPWVLHSHYTHGTLLSAIFTNPQPSNVSSPLITS